jgi:hypothetical protein
MDVVTIVLVIAGFVGIALAGARFGAGSTMSFAGLFARSGQRTWPQGIQESDAPRFALERLGGPEDAAPVRTAARDASSPIESVAPEGPRWRG